MFRPDPRSVKTRRSIFPALDAHAETAGESWWRGLDEHTRLLPRAEYAGQSRRDMSAVEGSRSDNLANPPTLADAFRQRGGVEEGLFRASWDYRTVDIRHTLSVRHAGIETGWLPSRRSAADTTGVVPVVTLLADDHRLANASTTAEVIEVLRSRGLNRTADRVAKLAGLHESDPEEPELNTESLRRMAETVLGDSTVGAPSRTVLTEEGFLHAEWDIGQGVVAMTFWPTARIHFAVLAPAADDGPDLHVSGLLGRSGAMGAVRWFFSPDAAP